MKALMTRRTTRRRGAALALTAAVGITMLAACGSDDEGDSSSANGSGETVKVMVYGPFEAKGFSLPGVRTGARAGVEKVNDEGGINGVKLELIECNDNNDPNAAAGCGRQAVAEGVVAVVGGVSTFEPQLLPVLEKAGIPVIGNLPVANFTSPVLYPFVGGGAGTVLGLGKALATNPECGGNVGVVQEQFAATDGVVGLLQLGIEASGATFAGAGKAPQNASDFAPAVAAATEGASCVAIIGGAQTTPQMVTAAVQSGKVDLMGSADSMVTNATVKSLGETAEGFLVTNEFLPLNDTTDADGMKEFLERGRAIDKDFDPDQSGASAYLAPLVIKKALEDAGAKDITAATITAALDELSGFDTGLGPIIDFTETNPAKAFSRLPVSTPMFTWIATDGVYMLSDAETFDLTSVYEAAAAAGQ